MKISMASNEPASIPSTYFSSTYGTANAKHSGNEWCTIADSTGQWQIPLEIRSDLPNIRDAITPYGYGGIYADTELTNDEIKVAWQETRRLLSNAGVISAFLRFAPFLDQQVDRFIDLEGLELEHASNTITIPLGGVSTAWSNLRGRARTAIRKAQAQGYTANVHKVTPSDVVKNSSFNRLYTSTMQRVAATSHYYFGQDYYRALASNSESPMFLAQVHDSSGNTVAASLVLLDQHIAHYHLSGSEVAAARLGANNLLIWSIIEWAAKRGLESLHLGGGTSDEDSLFRFKDSFGGHHSAFWIGKAIINPDAYYALVESHARNSNCSASELLCTGFFPAYRATVHHDLE